MKIIVVSLFTSGRKEIQKYNYLSEGIQDENLKKRAKGSLEYFINKAVWYKRLWQLFSGLTILLPAAATFLAAFSEHTHIGFFKDETIILAGITAVTTVVSSLLALSKCADKKSSYRHSAEALKREISLYLSSSGEYRKYQGEEKNLMLAERMEDLIASSYTKISALEKSGNITQKS